jgi:hypothetical protein
MQRLEKNEMKKPKLQGKLPIPQKKSINRRQFLKKAAGAT